MRMKNRRKSVLGKSLLTLVILITVALVVGGILYAVSSMEHYLRTYQNPLRVTAVVTSHEEYDDDGDTDYCSYVSYTVDGRSYNHMKFEDKDKKTSLTPVGTQVELQVSREDPAMQISELKSNRMVFYLTWIICSALLATVWNSAVLGKRSKGLSHTPDRETIQRDLRITVYGRFSNLFWLLLLIGLGLFGWRYHQILWNEAVIGIAASGLIWLWRVAVAMLDIRVINAGDYTTQYSTLIDKEVIEGDDSISYVLHYRSGEKTWKTKTSQDYYGVASRGDTVLTVFLPRKKKPVMYYNTLGNAC